MQAHMEDRRLKLTFANLGRRDVLVAEVASDALLTSLAKFSEQLRVVEAVRGQRLKAHAARS
jgi:hypothetical protein